MMNENKLAAQTKMILPMLLVAGLCFVGGMAVQTSNLASGAAPRAKLLLGSSASDAIKVMGAPVKISYDVSIQTWFYKSADKTTTKRLVLNQGVVVGIY